MSLNNSYLPYGKQTISEKDINAVIKVLKSEYLTQGPVVPEFENALSKEVNARHTVATNSATSALHIACLALGLEKEHWVWTSPTTFVASANCARYCGAKIDFVDIEKETGLMSITELKRKLERAKERNRLPKIVIPVHLTGSSCDMIKIKELSDEYGFNIIEDASHAVGGKYQEEPVGDCRYSDITIFSFHPVKIITSGEGGAATTNNIEIANKMRKLRSHGITKEQEEFVNEPAGPWSYEQQMLGYNYRMTDIHAALGLSQLSEIEKITTERRRQYESYKHLIKELPVSLLEIPPMVSHRFTSSNTTEEHQ